MAKKETTCSFCGANRANVQMLIAGVSGHICDSCAIQANRIVSEEVGETNVSKDILKNTTEINNSILVQIVEGGFSTLFSIY